MTPKQGIAFVARHGVVLQAARGPVPNLAEAVAGGPIRGSWWAHASGHEIFRVADAISENADVLVCKLIGGKITYVHRRLWPALVKLGARFDKARLAKLWDEHTQKGAHVSKRIDFPDWVPSDVRRAAEALSLEEAERLFAPWLELAHAPPGKAAAPRRAAANFRARAKSRPAKVRSPAKKR
jgi:hypothetical protein